MNATKRKPITRKPTQKTALTRAEEDHLASLSPKVRKLHMLAVPLRGKLNKVLSSK